MKLIISPAKKMNMEEGLPWRDYPVFLTQTESLMKYMQGLDYEEAKALWKCNDQIAALNVQRFADMNLKGNLSPAILAYEGIQYQYMAPGVFEDRSLAWIQEHLRILSGFYGLLRPMDGIVPYRLEMQAKIHMSGYKNLYDFWKDGIYRELTKDTQVILNLASKEYSKCIESYLGEKDRFITCIFAEEVSGKRVQKATLAKMARGEMVRYLAEIGAENPEEAKGFKRLGFVFQADKSNEREYVFVKQERP